MNQLPKDLTRRTEEKIIPCLYEKKIDHDSLKLITNVQYQGLQHNNDIGKLISVNLGNKWVRSFM